MPCPATLDFDVDGFTLLDLTSANSVRTSGGNINTSQMKSWITYGDPNELPIDKYYGETNGSKNGLKNAFPDDGTTRMLIPVYQAGTFDPATGTVYVIGFAAFVVDAGSVTGSSWSDSGSGNHTLTGQFVRFLAQGLPSGPGTGTGFGVYSVGLDG
jgi:hypothetical protein